MTKKGNQCRPYIYQEIEFEIHLAEPKWIATRITQIGNKPFSNNKHKNLFIPKKDKILRLTDDKNAFKHRHTGIVYKISENQQNGYIMPDKLYCNPIYFHKNSIQTTGIQKLFNWAQVEFDVKPKTKDTKYDQAIFITRYNGKLITAEQNILGNRRRYLGEIYKSYDKYANIASIYQKNRKRGYIAQISKCKLYGFILVFDNENNNELLHVHVDECHMFGNRKLRRFQLVEFVISFDSETNRKMAKHVTGPNLEILKYHSDNHFISGEALNKSFDKSDVKRHIGIVTKTPLNTLEPYIIKPIEYGYKHIIGYHGSLNALGSHRLQKGDIVEFDINHNLSTFNNKLQRAYNITAQNEYPLLLQDGEYGKYLQSKIQIQSKQHLLPEYGDNDENLYDVHGYIAHYNKDDKHGFIEIISSQNDQRYRRILFNLKDAILKDKKTDYSHYQPIHATKNKVIFTVCDIQNSNQLPLRIKNSDTWFKRKAINIVTEGKNYLEMGLSKK